MKMEGNENWARDESPFVFPSRILELEIRGGFERLQGSWAHVVFCCVKDWLCLFLLPVTRDGISQWMVWFG